MIKINIISNLIANNKKIELQNIALILAYNLNIIFIK